VARVQGGDLVPGHSSVGPGGTRPPSWQRGGRLSSRQRRRSYHSWSWAMELHARRRATGLGKKGDWTEGFTATAASVTECYLTVTDHSFSGIFRDGHLSVVFSKCRDLSML